jgi:hypothetical protein
MEQNSDVFTHQMFEKYLYKILFSLLSRPYTSRYECAGLLMIRTIDSVQKFWSPLVPYRIEPGRVDIEHKILFIPVSEPKATANYSVADRSYVENSPLLCRTRSLR